MRVHMCMSVYGACARVKYIHINLEKKIYIHTHAQIHTHTYLCVYSTFEHIRTKRCAPYSAPKLHNPEPGPFFKP